MVDHGLFRFESECCCVLIRFQGNSIGYNIRHFRENVSDMVLYGGLLWPVLRLICVIHFVFKIRIPWCVGYRSE